VALAGFVTAQVGFPMTVRPDGRKHIRPCGCVVADDSEPCCCTKDNAPAANADCCPAQPDDATPVGAAEQDKPTDACPLCHEKPEPTPIKPRAKTEPGVTWMIGSLVQHCHGVQTSWVTLGAVVPPLESVRVPVDRVACGQVPLLAVAAVPVSLPPNEPPPRSISA
jgi:hypothetical protein